MINLFKDVSADVKIKILDTPKFDMWIDADTITKHNVMSGKDCYDFLKPVQTIPRKLSADSFVKAKSIDYADTLFQISNGPLPYLKFFKGRAGSGKSYTYALSKIITDMLDAECPARLVETDGSHYLKGDGKYYPILVSRKIREKAIEWMVDKNIAYVERKVKIRGYRLAFDIMSKRDLLRFKLRWSDG